MKHFEIFVLFIFLLSVNLARGTEKDETIEKLFNAVKSSNFKSTKKSIVWGADVNAKDKEGFTALRWATLGSNIKIVKLLIKKGANVNALDNYGRTPIHWAAYWNCKQCVILLARKMTSVNHKDKYGKTAINIANEEGHTEIVNLLKSYGGKQ